MELNNKEKKIKQVLSEVNYEIDTDFLWKEVSQELDKEKKKKRGFFWIFPFFGIGLAALLFFNKYEISNKSMITQVDKVSKQSNINSFSKEQQQEELISISKKQELNSKLDHSNTIDLSVQEVESNLITKEPTKTNNTLAQSNNSFRSTTSTTLAKQNRTTTNQNKVVFSSTEGIRNNNFNLSTSAQVNKKTINTVIDKSNDVWTFLLIDKFDLNSFDIRERAKEKMSLVTSDIIEIEPLGNRFFITAGIGSIQDISTITTNDDLISNKFFEREKSLWGMNASLQAGMELNNKFKIFGGFDYAQLVTQYYNGAIETVAGTTPTTLQSINSANALTTTEGVLITSTTVDKDILWHRHHNNLDFQLGISKDLLPNSQFTIAPEFSLLQNVFTSHKGYYFNEVSSDLITFSRGEKNPYRKNSGIKTQLGLNLAYRTTQYEFAINTAWRNPISSITNETNIYQIKNSQLSIQARISYLLNWNKN